MNYKGEIQYVRFYTAGSAAEKLAPRSERKSHRSRMPQASVRDDRRQKVVLEPFALVGTVVAVVLAICVLCGFWQLNRASRQEAAMVQQISTVTADNAALQEQYRQGYDPEEIRITAEAMGLVPMEQVKHIKIHVQEPVCQPEPTFWEHFWEEVRELFA